MKQFISLFCLLALIQSSIGQNKSPQHFKKINIAKLGLSPKKAASLDSLLQSYVSNKKLNCVEAFVTKGGNIIYNKAFGLKDPQQNIPATTDDYYELFSQTKAITTVAFMTLVDKGLVSIEDPVSKYFPEIPNTVVTKVNPDGTFETRPVKTPMTFAHLMSHTSGLNAGLVKEIRKAKGEIDSGIPGYGGTIPEKVPNGQYTFGLNLEAKYLSEQMLDLAKYPLGFDPGSDWNYHPSSNMLAYLIERISGKPLRQYVKETIFEPLGMKNTDWFFPAGAKSRFVKPYTYVDGKLQPGTTLYLEGALSSTTTYAEGGMGLNGTIEDYAKFCQMLLNKGEFNGHRILKPETVKLMTTINRLPTVNSAKKGFRFGLGFELFNPEKKPIPAVSDSAYAWGGMLGTEYIIDPENDVVILFYINMFERDWLYPDFLTAAYDLVKSGK